jgi:uncharacterized Tic20 family protein
LWATLIHIGGIFFGILPSLIGYLLLKDRGEFVFAALHFMIVVCSIIAAVAAHKGQNYWYPLSHQFLR